MLKSRWPSWALVPNKPTVSVDTTLKHRRMDTGVRVGWRGGGVVGWRGLAGEGRLQARENSRSRGHTLLLFNTSITSVSPPLSDGGRVTLGT